MAETSSFKSQWEYLQRKTNHFPGFLLILMISANALQHMIAYFVKTKLIPAPTAASSAVHFGGKIGSGIMEQAVL